MAEIKEGISLCQLAERIGGEIAGSPQKTIYRAAPFEEADEKCITFADRPALLKRLSDCRAGAVVVPQNIDLPCSSSVFLRHENPRLAFAEIMAVFYPRRRSISGISPAASIGRGVAFGEDVIVGANAYIGPDVQMGSRVVIHSGVYIGEKAVIGDETEIFPNVTVMDRCVIGKRVMIHPGTVIGSDGFGFTPDGEAHRKIPQTGIVEIEDDVEIGACNTIDRATFGRTLIGQGVKTDNLVHIAHNVTIGDHSLIVAQVGVAGSTKVGRHVTVAGQAAIAGHLEIGDGAVIGPRAGVARNIAAGRVVSGTPEMDHRRWLRVQRLVPRLPELHRQVIELEKRLRALEKESSNTSGNGVHTVTE